MIRDDNYDAQYQRSKRYLDAEYHDPRTWLKDIPSTEDYMTSWNEPTDYDDEEIQLAARRVIAALIGFAAMVVLLFGGLWLLSEVMP